jgi:hypothetical protein
MKTRSPLRLLALFFAISISIFGGRALAQFPSTVDSDVYLFVFSPSFEDYQPEIGRLQLHLKPGSTTKYVGTFLDSFGLKTYAASADVTDSTAPVVVLSGFNGRFVIKCDSAFGSHSYSGTSTSVPPALKDKTAHFQAALHSTSTASLNLRITEQIGHVAQPDFEINAIVAINYDANAYISGGTTTSTDSKGHQHFGKLALGGRYAPGGYAYLEATISGIPFTIYVTISDTAINGYAFSGTGGATRMWKVIGDLGQ